MTDWAEVPLGEVTTQVRDSVTPVPEAEYRLLGLRMHGGGVYERETVTTETSKAKTFYRAKSGQFIYNRMFAWGGTFGIVPPALDDSFVSNEFPIFECDEDRLLVGYLSLYFQQPTVWSLIDDVSTGTTKSRNRWKESLFAEHCIPLPPLDVQHRIVDLLAVVDEHITSLTDERDAALSALERTATETLESMPTTALLGRLASTRSGPSYAASDVSGEAIEGAVPVIGIPNTRPDGTLDLSQIGYVSGLPKSIATIDDCSLVLIRTNGNRQRIGNVYLPSADAHGHAVSAFQFLLKVNDPSDREFVFWTLREPGMQARMSEAASGTTGLGNLAVKWLNNAEVPWSPDPHVRAMACELLRAQQDLVDALHTELAETNNLRACLLSALLTEDAHIANAYDQILHEVA